MFNNCNINDHNSQTTTWPDPAVQLNSWFGRPNVCSQHSTSPSPPAEAHLIDVPQARSYEIKRRFVREPPIYFFTHNTRGIRLSDALKENFLGLVEPDVQVIEVNGDKISYMFEWPGYQKVTKQVNARRKNGAQNRGRIAEQVAAIVDEFIGKQANVISSVPAWRVGQDAIDLHHIYLVEIKRISKATWVVELAVAVE